MVKRQLTDQEKIPCKPFIWSDTDILNTRRLLSNNSRLKQPDLNRRLSKEHLQMACEHRSKAWEVAPLYSRSEQAWQPEFDP